MKKKMKGGKKKSSGGMQVHQIVHNHIHHGAAPEAGNDADRALSKLKYKNFK